VPDPQPYIGEIRLISFPNAPSGWGFCNGQILPIANNEILFELLGTQFGGDGTSNFALPNLQGRVIRHANGNASLVGQVGGASTHTLTTSQIPTHTHTLFATSNAADTSDPAGALLASAGPTFGDAYGPATNLVAMAPDAIAGAGGSQPHTNMQPYMVLKYIIALEGIDPDPD
jgi:microcystin-dependent protein